MNPISNLKSDWQSCTSPVTEILDIHWIGMCVYSRTWWTALGHPRTKRAAPIPPDGTLNTLLYYPRCERLARSCWLRVLQSLRPHHHLLHPPHLQGHAAILFWSLRHRMSTGFRKEAGIQQDRARELDAWALNKQPQFCFAWPFDCLRRL